MLQLLLVIVSPLGVLGLVLGLAWLEPQQPIRERAPLPEAHRVSSS